jgi:putative oxidoreductase
MEPLRIVAWIVTGLISLEFLIAGVIKLRSSSKRAQEFARYGYPAWFRSVICVLELAGAVGLIWPPTHVYAAVGLALIMVGAFVTLLRQAERARIAAPVVTLVLLLVLMYLALRSGSSNVSSSTGADDHGQRSRSIRYVAMACNASALGPSGAISSRAAARQSRARAWAPWIPRTST